jgi:hypothetical protein
MGRAKHLQDQIERDAVASGAVVLCPICSGYPISTGDDAARAKAVRSARQSDAADEMAAYIDSAGSLCPSCGIPASAE